MTTAKPQFLKDMVRVYCHIQKPYGVPDERTFFEIGYDSTTDLEPPPSTFPKEVEAECEMERIEIYVPKPKATILFVVTGYMENSWGPSEEFLHCPYRKV